MTENRQLQKVVGVVACLNFAYFFVEFIVAFRIGSVSLFADSIDFLEDAALNLLIFKALDWAPKSRAKVGLVLSGILLFPALAMLWALWQKFNAPIPPEPIQLSITGFGAFSINLCCALLLAGYRKHSGSLTKAAFLSARNDVLANIAIVAAGLITFILPSVWPDLIVGLGIAFMNMDAAREVWLAARSEHGSVA